MSHTDHVRGTRAKRQLLAEEHRGRTGQTRAKRSDEGREASIAESLSIFEELDYLDSGLGFWSELREADASARECH